MKVASVLQTTEAMHQSKH